jgi:hypothetical protein
MRAESFDPTVVRPFLFRTATPREAGTDIPGSYDPAMRVWAVDVDGVRQPIITAAEDTALDIETTTKVRSEAEEEEIFASVSRLAVITTKTAAREETDDEPLDNRAWMGLSELATKTDVQHESDDQIEHHAMDIGLISTFRRRAHSLMAEIETFAEVEREDQDEGLI